MDLYVVDATRTPLVDEIQLRRMKQGRSIETAKAECECKRETQHPHGTSRKQMNEQLVGGYLLMDVSPGQ